MHICIYTYTCQTYFLFLMQLYCKFCCSYCLKSYIYFSVHQKWTKPLTIFIISITGISRPRVSVGTHSLASPLDIAATLQTIPERKHESVTALVGAWSELLLNDLVSVGSMPPVDCCSESAEQHPECYGRLGNGQCKVYMRSLPTSDPESCNFGKLRVFVAFHLDAKYLFVN